MGMKGVVVSIMIISFLSGCSKNSTGESDNIPPVITINSPAAGTVLSAGELIEINGTITDDKYIAEVHIHVTNNNTGMKLLDVHLYPGSNVTTFSNQSLTAASGISYHIQIIAIDRAVNQSVSSIDISCN
jgi:hypothetical protein